MGAIRDYVGANLRASFTTWHAGYRVGTFLGFVVAGLFAAAFAYGYSIAFTSEAATVAAVGLVLWFIFLVLVVTPFRMWRGQRDRILELEQSLSRRATLAEIDMLRRKLAALRIEMEDDQFGKTSVSIWEKRFSDLEIEIAAKIELFANDAEAGLYKVRGNLDRRYGPGCPPHQLYIDMAIHDLDYLHNFIAAFRTQPS